MIDGPRLPPASGRPARKLVVFLHGYGADGNDLIDIGRHWQALLPDAAFVSPHAPDACGMAPMGREWFALERRDAAEMWAGVQHGAPALNAFLDAELAKAGLADADLALVGFSQGTMMALHAGLRRQAAPAGIVGYSGLLAGAEHLTRQIRVRPPVLLVHGAEDPVIPVAAMTLTGNALAAAGVPVEWHVRPGLPHGIDAEGLALGGTFLKRVLA